MDERVTRLVHALRDRGMSTGDAVVAMVGNQVELVELSLACALGGWLLVPVNWHWVPREVAHVLDDAEPAAVVVAAQWFDVVAEALDAAAINPSIRLAIGPADQPGFEGYEAVLASGSDGPIEDAQRGGPMFYTSGTTGLPKGVRSSLSTIGGPPEMFTLMAHSIGPVIGIPPTERRVQLICGPMYHSAQWVFALFSLGCGASVVLQQRFDAAEVLDLVDRYGVTNLHLVPTQMARLLALPDEVRARFDGSSLMSVLHGAAPCPPVVKRGTIDWLGPIVAEYYGGTEGGFIAMIDTADWQARPGSVGKPVEIIEVVITDGEGLVLPAGETGDIWFRNIMGSDFSYHNAPDKTTAAHREDGFGTLGDVGHFDEDGYLYLSDRRIDMIVSGGVNIYPAEVEHALLEHPAITDAAVFGVPHEEMGESVHAAVAVAGGHAWSDALEAELETHCRSHLAGYKRPRSFEVHEALPRSEAGKLTKRTLRDPWWQDQPRTI